MKEYRAKILDAFFVTHDVRSFVTERPEGYSFEPGQATEVSLALEGWEKEKRPFTFTGLPGDDLLQFIIKTYPERKSVTGEMLKLRPGDELLLHDVFGTITYRGKGTFIAGGAGITPFIAIFRNLRTQGSLNGNKLIFGNRKKEDIILEKELKEMFGNNISNILSEEDIDGYDHGYITEMFLRDKGLNPNEYCYVCGPPPMMDSVAGILPRLGIPGDMVIKEGLLY